MNLDLVLDHTVRNALWVIMGLIALWMSLVCVLVDQIALLAPRAVWLSH